MYNGPKLGFDLSKQAVKCAKLIHPGTKFYVGSFSDVPEIGTIKIAIFVNFTAGLEGSIVYAEVASLLKSNNVESIIVDTFPKTSFSYPFLHDWQEYFGSGYKCVKRRGFRAAENNRRFIEFWEKV